MPPSGRTALLPLRRTSLDLLCLGTCAASSRSLRWRGRGFAVGEARGIRCNHGDSHTRRKQEADSRSLRPSGDGNAQYVKT